jgi:hypothetical protein
MKSLMYLEAALLEGKTEGISAYFAEIDRQTSNDMMKKAGAQFGFKTLEVNGMVIANMATASLILGYTDPWGLSKLLSTYQIMTYKIGWFLPEVVSKLRKCFKLKPKDSKATFITWEAFLLTGMYGQNEEARKIKLYLLKMETVGRVALSHDPKIELAAQNHELKRMEISLKYACKIDNMKDGVFKARAIEDYEKLTGRTMPESKQKDLFKKS